MDVVDRETAGLGTLAFKSPGSDLHLCLGVGCLSLVLVFTREGWGMGCPAFRGRGLGDEDANVCLEVRSDTKRTFYLSKIFFNL